MTKRGEDQSGAVFHLRLKMVTHTKMYLLSALTGRNDSRSKSEPPLKLNRPPWSLDKAVAHAAKLCAAAGGKWSIHPSRQSDTKYSWLLTWVEAFRLYLLSALKQTSFSGKDIEPDFNILKMILWNLVIRIIGPIKPSENEVSNLGLSPSSTQKGN